MTAIMFSFFTDSVSGAPSFSASDAATNPFGYKPLLLLGVGS